MKVIIGRPVRFELNNKTGRLRTYIIDQNGNEIGLDLYSKAMFEIFRFALGRRIADQEIRIFKQEWKNEREMPWSDFLRIKILERLQSTRQDLKPIKRRNFQWITDGLNAIAVATEKHAIISEQEVYSVAEDILKEKGYILSSRDYLMGKVAVIKDINGVSIGVQFYAGTINTYRAISISTFLEVKSCLNPLSWLNIKRAESNFLSRILRIEDRSELRQRISSGLEEALSLSTDQIIEMIKRAKRLTVNENDAQILISSMCTSWAVGIKATRKIFERFKEEEQNLWGLSQAISWVARHEHKVFKQGVVKPRQSLASLAGAVLLITDSKEAINRSLNRIEQNRKAKQMLLKLQLEED